MCSICACTPATLFMTNADPTVSINRLMAGLHVLHIIPTGY